jgi:hypothetical protein
VLCAPRLATRGSKRQKARSRIPGLTYCNRFRKTGAGDGIRTHDPNLGKVVLFRSLAVTVYRARDFHRLAQVVVAAEMGDRVCPTFVVGRSKPLNWATRAGLSRGSAVPELSNGKVSR